jgi:phage FluMu protein Com
MKAAVPLSDDDKRRLVLRLLTQLRCAKCNHLYDPEDFSVVHHHQDVWVLSTRCRHCNDTCHVVVFMHLQAEPKPRPIIDLTPEEKSAGQPPPITTDDVLDIHNLLREFNGDFQQLFSQ